MNTKTKIKLINGDEATIVDTPKMKLLKSENYNFMFQKESGFFARWGKTKNDDGDPALGLPEILDFEVSTKCAGVSMKGDKASPCKFCYKSNNNTGSYMTTENFTKVIDKMPKSLTQCALGIGNVDQPNLFELMDVLIARDIKPNLTINGDRMTPEIYDNLASRCGAIAVSYYDKDLTFNAVYELATVRKMSQINIHFFLSEETYEKGLQLIEDAKSDPRMKDLNAIVFLSAKLRGNAEKNDYHILSQEKYNKLALTALNSGINVGMDSCSAMKTLIAYKDVPNFEDLGNSIEPCESGVYSSYINKDGYYFPCSFTEGLDHGEVVGDWREGINVLECDDFLKDIWFAEKTRKAAKEVIRCRNCSKSCSIFEI
jgi:MoaA/NifB/PqqE/SkfB family radical SAM enzyme